MEERPTGHHAVARLVKRHLALSRVQTCSVSSMAKVEMGIPCVAGGGAAKGA